MYGVYIIVDNKSTLDALFDDYTDALGYANYLAAQGYSVVVE